MDIQDDWKSYVADPSRFNKLHFESLMLELETLEQLHEAFDNLPAGSEFVDRLNDLRAQADFSGTYLVPHAKPVTDESRRLAEQYRDNVFDYLREQGDQEAGIIAANPITEISMDEYRIGKKTGNLCLLDAPMNIDFNHLDVMDEYPKWLDGLREALYMMTTIPEVTRYLLSPIVKFPLDDGPAAALWLQGQRMDFCKDRTLLIGGGTSTENS